MKPWPAFLIVLCLLVSASLACSLVRGAAPPAVPSATPAGLYDPTRDPAADLQVAITQAQAENKRILLEVGGNWCTWCYIMHDFYADHPDLQQLLDEAYIVVRVNFSPENPNEAFLAQYPEISGFPHLFVLESDGTFLHSQNTADLEAGNSYNLKKYTAFLNEWAKPAP